MRFWSGVMLAGVLLALHTARATEHDARLEFDIDEQPLARALLEFSRQSNTDIVAPSQLIDGKRSRAVNGAMTAVEALNQILIGSGLRAIRASDGSLAIVRAIGSG